MTVEPSELTMANLDHVITVQDVQALGMCVRGQRRFWNSDHELSELIPYNQFVKDGATVRQLIESGNEYIIGLINQRMANG